MFVQMYHPQIAATATTPVEVSLSSVDDHAARGWLLVDPGTPVPAADPPFLTSAALVSQISTGTGPVGSAQRAASVAAVQDAIADGDIEVSGGGTQLTVDGVPVSSYDLDTTPVAPSDIGAASEDALSWARQASGQIPNAEVTVPRLLASNGATLSSGTMRLAYWTAQHSATYGTIRVAGGSAASGAPPTVCRLGVYSIDSATGNLTLIAACANDTTLFNAAGTMFSRPLTTPVTLTAGQRYAMGFLVVTTGTAPNVTCASTQLPAAEMVLEPRLSALLTAQTDLPASITAGALTTSTAVAYGALAA